MARSSDPNELRDPLDNALSVLGATPSNDVSAVRQTFELLKSTLAAVRTGLDELEAQLDVVNAPERDAAKAVVDLERELVHANARLEQELIRARATREAEQVYGSGDLWRAESASLDGARRQLQRAEMTRRRRESGARSLPDREMPGGGQTSSMPMHFMTPAPMT